MEKKTLLVRFLSLSGIFSPPTFVYPSNNSKKKSNRNNAPFDLLFPLVAKTSSGRWVGSNFVPNWQQETFPPKKFISLLSGR